MGEWCKEEKQVWAAASHFYTSLTCRHPPSHTTGTSALHSISYKTFNVAVVNWCCCWRKILYSHLKISALTVSRPTLTFTQALGERFPNLEILFVHNIVGRACPRLNWCFFGIIQKKFINFWKKLQYAFPRKGRRRGSQRLFGVSPKTDPFLRGQASLLSCYSDTQRLEVWAKKGYPDFHNIISQYQKVLIFRYAETGSVSEEESGTWRRSSVPLLHHQVSTPLYLIIYV